MVKEDFKNGPCLEVGEDKIGDYYESDGRWGFEELKLEYVLNKYSISISRYAEYKKLFKITKTDRASYCAGNQNESYNLLAYRSGLAVSGCALDIYKKYPIPESSGKRNNGEDFTEVTILKNGWFMEYSCT